MVIDPLRHFTVFDPHEFKYRVDVIGCGAIGSHVVTSLAKLGVANLHYWDDDIVESHNIANQAFHPSQIGQNKALALSKIWGGNEHVGCFEPSGEEEIIFLCVDSMETRKEIMDSSVRLRVNVKLAIETRMGLWAGRIYSLDPTNMDRMDLWYKKWYPDEKSFEEVTDTGTACQVGQTLGPVASTIANVAVVQMLRWWRSTKGEGDFPEFEVLLGMTPPDFDISKR